MLVAAPNYAFAQEQGEARVGSPCGARTDCHDGLHCVDKVCVDEEAFLSRSQDGVSNTTRVYLGGAIGGFLPAYSGEGALGEGVQFAWRFGVLIAGHFQLQLEVSPLSTALFKLAPNPVGVFEVTGTAGYLIPISDMVSWMFRFGGGGGALFSEGNPAIAFGEFRADVVGVAIRTSEHLLVEFNGPSFRVMFPQRSGPLYAESVIMSWVTNVGVSYLF